MTGIVSGIKRNAVHDGKGLRTTVFFKGCPLRCVWCHNPESLSFGRSLGFYQDRCLSCGSCSEACPRKAVRMEDGFPVTDRDKCVVCGGCADICPGNARRIYGQTWDPESLADVLAQDKPFFDNSGGGVTFSGGECLAQPVFAAELAKALNERGISVDIDTCGYAAQPVFDAILPYTDTFLYDLKAIDREVHLHCTGRENTCILDNLRYLTERGADIEIRYPLVPGWNDGECGRIGAFLTSLPRTHPIKVLGYHRFAADKYRALGIQVSLPPVQASVKDADEAAEILRGYGLTVINGMLDE